MKIDRNVEQRLFVITHDSGHVSTFGFDWVFRQLSRLAMKTGTVQGDQLWLSGQLVDPTKIGTIEQYEMWRKEFDAVSHRQELGTWFDIDTDRKVQLILERQRIAGDTLRLFYGDRETGRDWMEEHDVVGTVSRSTGPMKVPLLIPKGQRGGTAISDRNVVRILDWETGAELYRHPKYQVPELSIVELNEPIQSGEVQLTHQVLRDGRDPIAAFESFGQAASWVGFMTGDAPRMAHAFKHSA